MSGDREPWNAVSRAVRTVGDTHTKLYITGTKGTRRMSCKKEGSQEVNRRFIGRDEQRMERLGTAGMEGQMLYDGSWEVTT